MRSVGDAFSYFTPRQPQNHALRRADKHMEEDKLWVGTVVMARKRGKAAQKDEKGKEDVHLSRI